MMKIEQYLTNFQQPEKTMSSPNYQDVAVLFPLENVERLEQLEDNLKKDEEMKPKLVNLYMICKCKAGRVLQ